MGWVRAGGRTVRVEGRVESIYCVEMQEKERAERELNGCWDCELISRLMSN